MKASQCKKHLH
ncbi:hypothetical protein PENFLA_c064G04798 [Penicillium flavigenum]|uniref:Uncharacterized protein n=1 Tax=Penicillium flavigenum TaxID=254877 RepID=A0A1V6SGL1_9EURO|nr:hypothetical protein PENFLA_c064G04798 [Penicillium flavigenum]